MPPTVAEPHQEDAAVSGARRRLAVLGSPIAHSKSPALHAAAYRVLGLDWVYTPIRIGEGDLQPFLASRDEQWRGLSLTMPLKREVVPLLTDADELVRLTGVANTVLCTENGLRGFNTDVYGIEESFRRAGVPRLRSAVILGGGATAVSALVGVARMGAGQVTLALRDAAKAVPAAELAATLGVRLNVRSLTEPLPAADAVISTLPNGAEASVDPSEAAAAGAVLLDVAYEPWPTPLAAGWGSRVIPGMEMLLHQAVAQVRVFVDGDADRALPDEDRVLAAMRAAAGLAAG
jgi:shikimate dehydrogenase